MDSETPGPSTLSRPDEPSSDEGTGAFAYQPFRRFFTASVTSNTGTWMQSVAAPFAVFELTGSKAWLGTSAFAGLVIGAAANLPGGVLADWFSRRWVLACAQAVQMVAATGLWLLFAFGHPTAPLIVALLMLGSLGGGLTMPVWQSIVPTLVSPSALSSAVRLNSLQFAIARAVGPALAAVVLKTYGPTACFAANALTYPILIGVVLLLPEAPRGRARGNLTMRVALHQSADGWRQLGSSSLLRFPPMSTAVCAAFGFSLSNLAPAFAKAHFHHLANDSGALVSVFGLGGVVGAAGAVVLGRHLRPSDQIFTALGVFVIATAVLASTHRFWIGLVAFGLIGFANTSAAVTHNTVLQNALDDEYRGRIMGSYTQMFFFGSGVGSLLLGMIAQRFTVGVAAATSTAAFLVFLVVCATSLDRLRVLNRDLDPA